MSSKDVRASVRRLARAVLVALCVVSGARAQQLQQPQLDLAQAAPGPYVLHEWGVWRLRAGQIDHLDELARETPSFVHRAPAGPPPVTPRALEIALKPVMFVYADQPVDLDVMVEMPGGEPWLFFPEAIAGITPPPAARTVHWNVRALPTASVEARTASLPVAPPQHWWNTLRSVGASPLVAATSHESERFLFYDGPATFAAGWRARGTTIEPIAAVVGPRPTAWLVEPNGATRIAYGAHGVARTTLHDVAAVRTELTAALRTAGLSAPEVDSLLRTWDGDLFQSTARRAIWVLPRAAYDAMLPLTVIPRPRETVRVGVVIQLL